MAEYERSRMVQASPDDVFVFVSSLFVPLAPQLVETDETVS